VVPDLLWILDVNARKLSDFRFLRCNVVLTFKLNGNKFANGRLIAVVEPMPTKTGNYRNFQSKTSITGYQHGFLDNGSQTDLELTVPFVYDQVAYDFKSAYPWAQVHLMVFNVLDSTTAADNAFISVYVNVRDFSLSVRTANTVTPAPLLPRSRKSKKKKKVIPTISLQSEAHQQATTGSISTTVASVGKFAGALASTGIPYVSEAGAAVDWLAQALGPTLRSIGLSKPQTQAVTQNMVQYPMRYAANSDGSDDSVMLCGSALNSLTADNILFNSKKDEMDIVEVCSRQCYLEDFDWSTTYPPLYVINSFPVSPGFCGQQSLTEVTPTLLAYVSHMFAQWAGTIIYRIDAVCNQFYSGRLTFAFISGHTAITIGTTIDRNLVASAPKVVCDLQCSSTCTFAVPWVMNVPWLRRTIASRDSTGTRFTYANLSALASSQGMCVIYVDTPLRCPENVPQTIQLNLFAGGGHDIRFAIPACLDVGPVDPTPAPEFKKQLPKLTEQSDLTIPIDLNTPAGVIPPATPLLQKGGKAFDPTVASYTVGEAYDNLRPLTRQFSVVAVISTTTTDGLRVDPAYFGINNVNSTNSRVDRISRIYCFWRGGVRFKAYITSTTPIHVATSFTWNPPLVPTAPNGQTSPFGFESEIGFTYQASTDMTPLIEFCLPFYARSFLGVITDDSAAPRLRAVLYPVQSSTTTYTVYKAAADDFSFGFIIGPPNLKLYS
jgi:hypothetical protein